jgi:hypothetical protein
MTIVHGIQAQQWKPAMEGLLLNQNAQGPDHFDIKFKHNIVGRDWIFGKYLDSDTLKRCVAYREGGKWISLPFSVDETSVVADITMQEDTLCLLGRFRGVELDYSTDTLPDTHFLKWFNDSLWGTASNDYYYEGSISSKGDSILYWGTGNYTSKIAISTNGGKKWGQIFPFSPTDRWPEFGKYRRIEILENGHILMLNNHNWSFNNQIQGMNQFQGILGHDGIDWVSYGDGVLADSKVVDFEVLNQEYYMIGTFDQITNRNNPGNYIARWDGSEWNAIGTGLSEHPTDLFSHNGLMYCMLESDNQTFTFSDAAIPYLAAWDGHVWCGTPSTFSENPNSFGFAKDTLFVSFENAATSNGNALAYLAYFDGDYANGPDAVCSTFGIGIEELETAGTHLDFFPNPSTDEINIQSEEFDLEKVELLDISGKQILEVYLDKYMRAYTLDVSTLDAGLYTLRVNDAFHQKVLKKNSL